MDAEFGGRQLKDQPAVGRVVALDGIPAEHVAQCLAQPLRLARVEEHVRADDRHAVMLRLEYGISPRVRAVAVTGRSSSFGAGVRTERFAETAAFFRDVVALPVREFRDDFAWLKLPDSSQFEIFGPAEPDHDHFATGPVPSFHVDDV